MFSSSFFLSSTLFFSCLALFSTTGWADYVLQDDYFEAGFFDQFDFFDQPDPTHGFVSYKTYDESCAANLITNTTSSVYIGVDSENISPFGRNSVRITSKKAYNSGLVVVDIQHMPGGICGTWPAFWMVGPNWPHGGEIDIFEGANDQTTNDVTLHTGPGCSITNNGGFSGSLKYTSCASSGTNNLGCQIGATSEKTFGTGFNANGGGVYATEWTSGYISVWFFPRGEIPADVLSSSPKPSTWGTPIARFEGDCDMASSFTNQQLVFDTTFCGDWAGQAWWSSSSSCAALAPTCEQFVELNPSAFQEAYWSVNALKVYQVEAAGGYGSPPPPPPPSQQPSPSAYVPVTSAAAPVVTPYTPAPSVVQTTFAIYTTTAPNRGNAPMVVVVVGEESDGSIGFQAGVDAANTAQSPVETGTGSAAVVGVGGVVGLGLGLGGGGGASLAAPPPPAETQAGGGWFTTNSDGTIGLSGLGKRHRHARHLTQHKGQLGRRI